MTVGVVRESFQGESRVALVPAQVPSLVKAGLVVRIESGAGIRAGYPDEGYAEKGASVVTSREAVLSSSDVVLAVRSGAANPVGAARDLESMTDGAAVIGLLEPYEPHPVFRTMLAKRITAFALELMPRITRAQSMDVLSSMASIAGYKAALIAAAALGRMFPMMMTAAGTIVPAKVFVIGAGVAGLQAIATCGRLGAVVRGYDIRPVVKEQVESLGAKFVLLDIPVDGAEGTGGYAKTMGEEFYRKQREKMLEVVRESDVVITTAAVPGQRAPLLVSEDMVRAMAPGSVVVDLAAERGGNCELSRPGATVERHGVSIIAPANLPSTVPYHASQLFARNTATFLLHLMKNGSLSTDRNDEIVRETLVAKDGEVVHDRLREILSV